jgi:ElaB/YqjD/DUF883 family membrane-anchored ribosome-binding protein
MMVTSTKSNRNAKRPVSRQQAATEPMERVDEVARNVVDYLTEYARENPGHAALTCLGVGFVLGWKLKPW